LFCKLFDFIGRLICKVCSLFAKCNPFETSIVVSWIKGSKAKCLVTLPGLFGAFFFVMYVIPHDYWNNGYGMIAAIGFVFLFLVECAYEKREFFKPKKLGFAFYLFVFCCALSIPFSYDIKDSIRIFLILFTSFIFCWFVCAVYDDEEKLRTLLGFIYWALVLISIYAIAQRVFGLVKVNASYTDLTINAGVPGRVYATLDNPNNLSMYIVMFLPLACVYAGFAKKDLYKLLLCFPLVLPCVAMIMTYSRSGWIGLALSAIILVFCWNKALIPALGILGICALPFLPASVYTRLSTIGNKADTSTNHRLDIWKGLANLLTDDYFFATGIGLGPNALKRVYEFYSQGTAKIGVYNSQLHYIELILETGLLSLIAYIAYMLRYAGAAIKAVMGPKNQTKMIVAAGIASMLGLAFIGLVEYIWFYQRLMMAFFILLGIIIAAFRNINGEN